MSETKALQQQFINQVFGRLFNNLVLRVLHKLSAAVLTLKVLFAVVNSAILDAIF